MSQNCGPVQEQSALAERLAAICAEQHDRPALEARVREAISLERATVVGFVIGLLFKLLVFVALVGGLVYVVRKFMSSSSSRSDW